MHFHALFFSPPPLSISPHANKKPNLHLSPLRSSLKLQEVNTIEEDVMHIFLNERKLNGDFISKISDKLWMSDKLHSADLEGSSLQQESDQCNQVVENERDNGLLKLTAAREWVSGVSDAPANKKLQAKEWQNESEKRKKLNLLRYEALKRELLFLTVGVGAACTAYCLITFSFQAAISYASGVLFSCLYLQLLTYHADNITKKDVPEVFLRKKAKKIGIRSEDLKEFFEKTFSGASMALSSPRLVIPVAIYGLWALSQHFSNDYFDFQIVPGMFGFLAYKGAALVQVYRDNEDLQLIFPDDE